MFRMRVTSSSTAPMSRSASTAAVARMSSATFQNEPDSYAENDSKAGVPSARPSITRPSITWATNSDAEKGRSSHNWKSSSVTTVVQAVVSGPVVSHNRTPSVVVRPHGTKPPGSGCSDSRTTSR